MEEDIDRYECRLCRFNIRNGKEKEEEAENDNIVVNIYVLGICVIKNVFFGGFGLRLFLNISINNLFPHCIRSSVFP